jgi:hypothetical protein
MIMLEDAVRLKAGEWPGTLQTENGPMPMNASQPADRAFNEPKLGFAPPNAALRVPFISSLSQPFVPRMAENLRSARSSVLRMSARLPIFQPPDVQQIAFEINLLTRLVSVGIRPFRP